MIVETDSSRALATYCAVSLLCIFMTPNVEASLLFILFTGYYPILQFRLKKLKNRPLVWTLKLLIFNAAIIIYYNMFKFVFTSVDMMEGSEFLGKYALPVFWAEAQVCFLLYDKFLSLIVDVYVSWFRKKILRRK